MTKSKQPTSKQRPPEWTRPYLGILYPQTDDAPLVRHASVVESSRFTQAYLFLKDSPGHYTRVFMRKDYADPVAVAKKWLQNFLRPYRTGRESR